MEHGGEALVSLSKAIADAVESVSPSIVRVDGRGRHPASGVVYAPEMVLTANHALKRDEDVAVVAGDGSSLPARLAGRDHATDLAVLRVDGLGVEAATPALEPARVGEISVAVGRSFRDDGPRATLGIVSAVGGPLRMGRGLRLERYLQTDAAPLSGGGALVNARGAVIGVPVASLRRGTMLAVPADVAWEAAKALQSGGTARRGYLGILSQPANIPDTQRAGFDQGRGLLVVGVEDDSPAARGGVLVGDIILDLDGRPVEDTDDLLSLLIGERVGAEVPVGVLRGGDPVSLSITVGERG